MRFPALRPSVAILSILVLVSIGGPPCLADTPILADSFRPTTPGHGDGDPVDGAALERGHGRWSSTPGLYFHDGAVRGGGVAEHARVAFVPSDHSGSARVYLEALLDPGANGWSGVGFTDGEDGPLPSVGQLWMKIDDRGRIEVRADGASSLLYKDSHQHPAYVPGINTVRLEYNRRLNTARAWVNGAELPLDELGGHGFVPDIRAVAFQLRDDGGGLKVLGDESGAGGVLVGMVGAVLGDQFTTGPGRGVAQGAPLNGVTAQYGNEIWTATPSVGFGPGYATNIGLDNCLATLPFDPDDHPGYAVSSIEAMVNPAREGSIAIGFSGSGTGSFTQDGAVWARLLDSGGLQVYAAGTSVVIFDDLVAEPGAFSGGIPVKLSYNRLTGEVRVDLGELEMGIEPVVATLPGGVFPLTIGVGGFEAYRSGGFTSTNQFAVDDLAFHVDDDIPVLAITQHPVSVETVFGSIAEFHCAASGGVPPYTFEWQQQPKSGEGETWNTLVDGVNGISGVSTPDLVVYPVTFDNDDRYRCLVRDSNSVPGEAPSAEASLSVTKPITTDSFTTGGSTGRTVGSPIGATEPEYGDGPWSATPDAVFGDGVLTNAVTTSANVLAEVPVTSSMTATFNVLSTSASVLVGNAEWVGVGFSSSALQSFTLAGSGQLWVRVASSGRVKVHANSAVIFDSVILDSSEIQQPVAVRVDYDADAATPRAWVNGDELTLGATAPLGPFGAAGVNARKTGGFASPGMLQVDNFALSGADEFPLPAFTERPQSQSAVLGSDITLTCAAEGGIAPLAFRWFRASGGEIFTGGPYTVVPGGATSSTLTIAGLEPSLDGSYVCEVTDARYGDPRPIGASGYIRTILPDFKILWGGRAGDNVFTAEAYEQEPGGQQLNRVEFIRAGSNHKYKLEVDFAVGSAPDSSLSYPLTVWGACHEAGVEPALPYSYLGTIMSNGGGQEKVEFEAPVQCLAGSRWGILSLMVDINAVENPSAPGGVIYPDSIEGGMPYLPEVSFDFGNRGQLIGWIPVIDGTRYTGLMSAILGDTPNPTWFELDFTSPGDAPDPDGYLLDWVLAAVQATQDAGLLTFHMPLWDPCRYIDDVIPNPTTEDPHTYQPYMAWDTNQAGFVPLGGITRHRIENAVGRRENALFLGYTEGEPPVPSVDMSGTTSGQPADPTDAAVLGPDGSGANSTNWLASANQAQYQVLVWTTDHSGQNWSDGLGTLEVPHFPDSGPDPDSFPAGSNTWVYLGFVKDGQPTWGNQIPCDLFDFEWYRLDAIRFWGTGGEDPPPTPLDYRARYFVRYDPPDWEEMPDEVVSGDEARVCLLAESTRPDYPAPHVPTIQFWKQHGNGDPSDAVEFTTEVVSAGGVGRTLHCLAGEATYTFDDCGADCSHWVEAFIDVHPDETNSLNNHAGPFEIRVSSTDCPVPVVVLP